MMKVILGPTCALLLATVCAASAFAQDVTNFGKQPAQIFSPDRAYVLVNSPLGRLSPKAHTIADLPSELRLKQVGNSASSFLMSYIRCIDVLWSPDGKAFAVNNWKSSATTDAYIFELTAPDHRIQVSEKLSHAAIPVSERNLIFNGDHSYIYVDRWVSPKELVVKASGHCIVPSKTVRSYTLYYRWNLKTNSWKLLKRSDIESGRVGEPVDLGTLK